MTSPTETLPVTFTYSHTRGVFTGHFPNGTSFDFIAAQDTFPIKLRNALQALAQRAHTEFKSRPRPKEMSDAEWNELMDKVQAFEAQNGVSRYKRKDKKPKRAVKHMNINLKDLEIKV